MFFLCAFIILFNLISFRLISMKELLEYIRMRLSNHFNQPANILNYEQVFGGDINQTFCLETNIGSFFLKLNNGSFKNMFEKEFEGLQLLHQAHTVKIPEPILYDGFEN